MWRSYCPSCGAVFAIRETPTAPLPVALGSAVIPPLPRIRTGIRGVDFALGGGFVRGASHLVFGIPSCGKSTLGLQSAAAAPSSLVIAADWSDGQAHAKWSELGLPVSSNHLVVEETQTHTIARMVRECRPALLVVDSWQFLEVPGQQGLFANMLQSYVALETVCVATNTALLLIGKTRKDRNFAGHQDLLHRITGIVLRLRKLRGNKRELVVEKTRQGPDCRRKLLIDAHGLRSPRLKITADPSNDDGPT